MWSGWSPAAPVTSRATRVSSPWAVRTAVPWTPDPLSGLIATVTLAGASWAPAVGTRPDADLDLGRIAMRRPPTCFPLAAPLLTLLALSGSAALGAQTKGTVVPTPVVRWTFASGPPVAPPAVADGVVFAGGEDGTLRAV